MHFKITRNFLIILVCLFAGTILSATWTASAQTGNTIVVNNGCTLSDAIQAANANRPVGKCPAGAGADTIVLSNSISWIERIETPHGYNAFPDIVSDITIKGNGLSITIERDGPITRFLYIGPTGSLTLENINFSRGQSSEVNPPSPEYNWGGFVFVDGGSLHLDHVSLIQNYSQDRGGAIYNRGGRVTVNYLFAYGNHTYNNLPGSPGAPTEGDTFYNDSPYPVEITYSEIDAGIYNAPGSTLNIIRSALDDVNNAGTLTIETSSFLALRNYEAATANIYASSSVRTSVNSDTFPSLMNDGQLTLTNSVIYNRYAIECDGSGSYTGSNNIDSTATCPGLVDTIPRDVNDATKHVWAMGDLGGPVMISGMGSESMLRDRLGDCGSTDGRGQQRDSNCDIGSYEYIGRSIIGQVWEDLTAYGNKYNYSYPGVEGVTLTLLDANGIPIATTTSVSDGYYVFGNISGDQVYSVAITLPENYVLTAKRKQPGSTPTNHDSDADPLTGITDPFYVHDTDTIISRRAEFGIYEPVTLTGLLFYDANGNGIHDPGEFIYRNRLVKAHRVYPSHSAHTYTNNNGIYTFTDLLPGTYTITAVTPDPIDSLNLSVQAKGTLTTSYEVFLRTEQARSRHFDLAVSAGSPAGPIQNLVETSTPTLSWGALSWATGYQLQIADNLNFNNVFVDTELSADTLDYTVANSLVNGIYYWRVRARRINNNWGQWSTPDTLVIEAY